MTPAERLAGLLGPWRVIRVLRHADGTRARFRGRADWTPRGPVLHCLEDGTLDQGGARYPASRVTLWRADATRLHVAFADGRPFHAFAAGPRAGAVHDCPPDTYRIGYDFGGGQGWSCRWHVTGPRKSYRALTRYRRWAAAQASTSRSSWRARST